MKNQQTLIDTTENCANHEINIDCGGENTSSIIATEHSYCKLENADVCLTCVDKSNLIEFLVRKNDTQSLTVKKKQKCHKLLNRPFRFSWEKVDSSQNEFLHWFIINRSVQCSI